METAVPAFTADPLVMGIVYTLIGLLLHILRKSAEQEVTPWDYVVIHKKRTSAAFSAIASAFTTLYLSNPDAAPLEYVAIAYVLDSLINKSPTSGEARARSNAKVNREEV